MKLKLSITLSVALILSMLLSGTAFADGAYANRVDYKGQGLLADGSGGYVLKNELCGTANGAEVDGPYLLFVLTATGAQNADITIGGVTYPMVKYGNGTFKYISAWYEPTWLMTSGNVYATYDGKPKNAQLVISHGCRPYKRGAWCSPGFWKNAEDAAWALTGYSKTALFNSTVVPNFYDTPLSANPTLYTTLTEITYKSGQLTSGPFGLTPFNATAAFLTNNIPGYQFDYTLYMQAKDTGETPDMCPIDHNGNFK